jgi:hypothetical protein
VARSAGIFAAYGLMQLGHQERAKAVVMALFAQPKQWSPRESTCKWLETDFGADDDLARHAAVRFRSK